MIDRIITNMSGLDALPVNAEAFNVYVTHQIDGVRTDTGPALAVAWAPDAYAAVKSWLLEDPKVVDFNLRPVSAGEYAKMRQARSALHMSSLVIRYTSLLTDGNRK